MYVWIGSARVRAKDAGLEVRGLWRSEVVVDTHVSSSSSPGVTLVYREEVTRRWLGSF